MSAAFIWIFFPILISLILVFLPGLTKLKLTISMVISAFLAILGWLVPIGTKLSLGPWTVKIYDTFSILGRTLTLNTSDKPILILFYLIAGLWFLGGIAIEVPSVFGPFGLMMVALLVAALAVEPFLYGALLIEMAVIVSVIFLTPSNETPGKGVLRYLIFQTLGIPFILFAGWMLGELEQGTITGSLIIGSVVMLGLGFAFLLAIFPFNTWLPLLTSQAEPYETGFVLIMLPMSVILFALHLIDTNSWLRNELELYSFLRIAGVLMIATGGIWAAFQNHLGRMLGYAIISETGFALLAIGLKEQGGLQLFAAQLLPRALGIWAWSFPISALRQKMGSLEFKNTQGVLRSYPFLSFCLLVGQFSLAGLPLLASFPIRSTLYSELFSNSELLTIWVFIGSFGLLIGGLRSLSNLATPLIKSNWKVLEKPGEIFFCSMGVITALVMGLFPQVFLPLLIKILSTYSTLL